MKKIKLINWLAEQHLPLTMKDYYFSEDAIETEERCCPRCDFDLDCAKDIYEVEGITYPKYLEEYCISSQNGDTHGWIELHCCPICETFFWFNECDF